MAVLDDAIAQSVKDFGISRTMLLSALNTLATTTVNGRGEFEVTPSREVLLLAQPELKRRSMVAPTSTVVGVVRIVAAAIRVMLDRNPKIVPTKASIMQALSSGDQRKLVGPTTAYPTITGKQAISGGSAHPGIIRAGFDIETALRVRSLPFRGFTAFNDQYHKGLSYASKHSVGLALDIGLARGADRNTFDNVAKAVQDALTAGGATVALYPARGGDMQVRDERNYPTTASTGPHIHVQFNSVDAARRYASFKL